MPNTWSEEEEMKTFQSILFSASSSDTWCPALDKGLPFGAMYFLLLPLCRLIISSCVFLFLTSFFLDARGQLELSMFLILVWQCVPHSSIWIRQCDPQNQSSAFLCGFLHLLSGPSSLLLVLHPSVTPSVTSLAELILICSCSVL